MTTLAPPTTYAAGLDAAHDSVAPDTPNVVVVGPGGFAYTTPARLAEGPSWLSAATGHRLHGADVRPVPNRVAAHHGVACVRLVDPTSGDPAAARPDLLRHHLLRAHTRLLARTVELAVADLGRRTTAGGPLLGRQLVQAGLADAVLLVEETDGLLDGGHDAHPAVFARLVRGGRALLRLLGGASFLIDGPGGAVLTAEQVGTLYLAVRHDR
ncbi:hypothetical protein [Saccharothrix variisporea]|uniref:Uncharacterized protein n=1 Tax=Saccharothrix variisporea TaxID=543527 RepID=A0A495XM20_9PSEU|nr:hypothetical protein [Saccharothrix variisporea]RKT74679.1 hypothetical protein DFJ66_8046 [Saccharothrix variisporea]